MHADRRGVDVDLAAGVAELFHRGRDDFAGVAIEFVGQRLGALARAVVDDDGRAVVRKRRDRRATRAACADDGDAIVRPDPLG